MVGACFIATHKLGFPRSKREGRGTAEYRSKNHRHDGARAGLRPWIRRLRYGTLGLRRAQANGSLVSSTINKCQAKPIASNDAGPQLHNEIPGFGKAYIFQNSQSAKSTSCPRSRLVRYQRTRLHTTRESIWDLKCRTLVVRLPRRAFDAPFTT